MQEFQAVEVLSDARAADLIKQGVQTAGARWACADANAKMRRPRQTTSDAPFAAKNRLLVQGCRERGLGIRGDAPAASLPGFHAAASYAASRGWEVAAADAATACWQSKRSRRRQPPRPRGRRRRELPQEHE